MEEIPPKKPRWIKIGLMMVVLVPFISIAFFLVCLWLRGVSFTH
jgi:hypothetical protein